MDHPDPDERGRAPGADAAGRPRPAGPRVPDPSGPAAPRPADGGDAVQRDRGDVRPDDGPHGTGRPGAL